MPICLPREDQTQRGSWELGAGSWAGQTGHSEESGGRGSGTTVCPGPLLGDRRLVGGGRMGNALSCCQDLGRVSWEERRAGWTSAAPRPGPRDSPSPPSPPHPGWLRSPPFAELEAWRARPWRTAATVRPPGQATSTVAAGDPSQGTASGRSASHRATATLHGLSPAAADWSKGDSWPRGASPPSRQLQSLE